MEQATTTWITTLSSSKNKGLLLVALDLYEGVSVIMVIARNEGQKYKK